ncbi:MAG: hypothetical protein GXO12_05330 [Epsilonproteobacteria bacterium]|nr:hypothetical protein [Campylobacterota bacterium]
MKILFLIIPILLQAVTFKVASYNVENLFDLKYSGKEYREYVPNSSQGWNRYTYQKKLSNISKVIYDLNADIIGLEEIESRQALLDLKKALKRRGAEYKYLAIADRKNTTVKTALLSKYKIIKTREIRVSFKDSYRNILEVHIDIDGKELIVFVNHWKSKTAPESERVKYAKALRRRLNELKDSAEYIIMGDFNSNYNENITFLRKKRLNNTHGKTGINDILKTFSKGKEVTVKELKKDCTLLYNLWLELPYKERFSYLYQGRKNTMDNMLVPCSMFNGRDIEYVKNSFGVFKPSYLFKRGSINRWERKFGYGKFTGNGYSDHLPIYAYFTTDKDKKSFPQKIARKKIYQESTIANLYKSPYIVKPVLIKDAAVIYKDKSGVVVKKINDRAVYIFHYNRLFKKGYLYDIVVKETRRYKGNLEVSSIVSATRGKRVKNLSDYYLHYKKGLDISNPKYQNEVLYSISGVYKNHYLRYAKDKKIRIFFRIKDWHIADNTHIKLRNVRIIRYNRENEILVEKKRSIIK